MANAKANEKAAQTAGSIVKQFEQEAHAAVVATFGDIGLLYKDGDTPKMHANQLIDAGMPFVQEGDFYVARNFTNEGDKYKIAVIRGYTANLNGLGCFVFANFA